MSSKNSLDLEQLRLNSLENTKDFYLECLKPIVNENIFEQSKHNIEDFILNEGKVLHNKLTTYANEIKVDSWLMPHGKDIYLSNRGPITILSNYTLETQPYNKQLDYLNFMTRLVIGVQDIFEEAFNKAIPGMKSKDKDLCMKQLKGFLKGSRVFNKDKDSFEIYEPYQEVNAIALFYRHNIYLLKIFNEDQTRVAAQEIYDSLFDIYHDTKPYPYLPLTLLAYNNHDESYDFIKKDQKLEKVITKINQAICGISMFDENSFEVSVNDKTYGNSFNLWPLKGWSISVYQDLVCSFNNEHTFIDGATSAYLIKRLYSLMNDHYEKFENKNNIQDYQILNMKLDQDYLEKIKNEFLKVENQFQSLRFEYEFNYLAKLKENKINIDSLFQLSYLYANYHSFNDLQTIHESVSVAHYYDGRTATMKTITEEGIAFVEALKHSDDHLALIKLLKPASDQHLQRISKTKDFLDIIRHYEGLRLMKKEPLVFDQDLGFRKYLDQQICTSSMGNSTLLNRFSYAPVSYGGIGLGYLSKNNILVADLTYYQSEEHEAILFFEKLQEFYDKLVNTMSLI